MTKSDSHSCCLPAVQVTASHDDPDKERLKPFSHRKDTPDLHDMVSLGADWFDMGSNESPHLEDGEYPVRRVWVDQFKISTTTVSNRQFKAFVDATGYKTAAEIRGSSFVFHLLSSSRTNISTTPLTPWWCDVSGACWHSPEGKGTSIANKLGHPVVHVTREDARQYCLWSGSRLPSEAEWEYAARGGLSSQDFPWGSDLTPDGQHRCNIWQGVFPKTNTAEDGYVGTAPVTEYSANAYGLFNMTGNVWEWVADRFTKLHSPRSAKNPQGPLNGKQFVAKGGSYLCHDSYCLRYRTSSRQALSPDVSAGHLGFRVAR